MLSSRKRLPQGLAIASQSAEFWRRLAPELTISDAQPNCVVRRDEYRSERERMRLVDDGYLYYRQPGIVAPMVDIANAMDRIVNAGLPAAFIGVYDEVWSIIAQMREVVGGLFGGEAALMPDFWADHTIATAGLGAQRRFPGQGVFADGTAKTAVIWVPVTAATTENGCLYVVPAGQDRNYGKPDPERADACLPGIRALPAQSGDAIVMTGETYHWQARPDRHSRDRSLMSLTWTFQSGTVSPIEGALIDSYPYVPFETRLAILANQMPRHRDEFAGQPVWRAVQQTLANRFPITAKAQRV